MKNKIILIALSFLLSACVSPRPALNEFIIHPDVSVTSANNEAFKDKTLKVENSYSSSSLKSRNMYYVEDETKQYHYAESQWAEAPNSMINKEILDMLRKMKLFGFIQTQHSKVLSNFNLETNIDEFRQYFVEGDAKSYVVATITFTLIDNKIHKIVANQTFTSRQKVDKLNASEGVKALNTALSEVLNSAAIWLKEIKYDK